MPPTVGNSVEGESGWSGLLIDLVRNFLLLRDIFGYLIPGIVFLFLGALADRFYLSDWMDLFELSFWERVIVFLVIALGVGHILVAIFYIPSNFRDLAKALKEWKAEKKKAREEKTGKNPSELTPNEVEGRARFPGLFLEYDRRTTVNIMTSGLAIALLLTCVMVYWPGLRLRYFAFGAGATLLLRAIAGRLHLARTHADVLKAIEDAKEHGVGSSKSHAGS